MNRYEKQKAFFKGYFLGREMWEALSALELASKHHTGFRKNGAPELSHQITIVGHILQAFDGRISTSDLEVMVTDALLHDIVEDYNVNIKGLFGHEVQRDVEYLTKTPGIKLDEYFDVIGESLTASVVKIFDRLSNLQTMVGGFNDEKIKEYIKETRDYVFPLINKVRDEHYEYFMICISAKHQMETIIDLIEELKGFKIN